MPIVLRCLTRLMTSAALAVAIVGCSRSKPQPPAFPPPKVTVTQPVMFEVQSYFEYNGYLEPIETVQIKARVKGVLKDIHFTEGTEVKIGDLLYTIDPREYKAAVAKADADIAKAEADINSAKAQIELAKSELERVQRATATGVGSKTDLDKAVATLAANEALKGVAIANKAAGKAAKDIAKLDVEYTNIKAPIDGQISRNLVTKGNLVGQNEATLLTTIVKMDKLHVYYDAAERDLIEFQKANRNKPEGSATDKTVKVEIGVATEDGYPHEGDIDFRENRVDTGTGTVRIRGVIPNPLVQPGNKRLLYPGLFARVRVPSGEPRSLPVIPEDALMTGQEGRFVYVLGPNNIVEKRSITVLTQPVWRAPPPGSPAEPGWMMSAPLPPPPGTEPPAAPPGPPGPPGPPPPPPGPVPVLSVVAVVKGLSLEDRVLVTGLTKARPGAPVAPVQRILQAPPAAPKKK